MNIIYYLILFYFLLSIILFKINQEYENYLSDPYITVYARDGLNNKLRVMLSYLYVANVENKKLRIIWVKDIQCPEDFKNLFEPINNVEIIYSENIISNNLIDFNVGWNPDDRYIKNNYFKYLKPIKTIQDDIDQLKILLQNNYIACHIRRTDISTLQNILSDFYINEDDAYVNFINQYPEDLKIYIATDNKDTQDKFINIYGNRIIYKIISKSDNLRQTSVQDAVKDMYVCAGATYFMGSPHSSFSDTINEIRKLST
jgi:hypothetical protein